MQFLYATLPEKLSFALGPHTVVILKRGSLPGANLSFIHDVILLRATLIIDFFIAKTLLRIFFFNVLISWQLKGKTSETRLRLAKCVITKQVEQHS